MFGVGDKVRYIGDGHGNATGSSFEPDVVGTVGIITYVTDRMKLIKVRWPEDATRAGRSDPKLGDEYYTSGDRLELFDEQQICVGDDVEFIDRTVTWAGRISMFPPVGTIGTVVGICEDGDLKVVWPGGTATSSLRANGCGWGYCKRSRVRKCSHRQEVNKELDTLFSEFEVQ